MTSASRVACVSHVCRWLAVVAALFVTTAPARAILTVDQLKPGMRGFGKTVFHGTKIERFNVEIIDILQAATAGDDTIIIRVSGPEITAAGGICAGMSGSPIYIGNDMIGALAYTTPQADRTIGFVTPIATMMKMLRGEKTAAAVPAPRLHWLPAMTPVMLNGFSGRAYRHLATWLQGCGLQPVEGGATRMIGNFGTLEPGSAIGIQLAHGDLGITAIGTLTYRLDNQVLAFGHPFMERGDTAMFLTPAYIHCVVKSDILSFKLGSPGPEVVGVVEQDRHAGLCARLGAQPPSLPLKVTVRDEDRGIAEETYVDIVRDPELLPQVMGGVALQCVDHALDRIGSGTSAVKWSIETQDGTRIAMQNRYYASDDIALTSLTDWLEIGRTVASNPFQQVMLKSVDLDVSVRHRRETARVLSVELNSHEVVPGATLTGTVRFQPYQKTVQELPFKLQVPADTDADEVYVVAGQPGVATAWQWTNAKPTSLQEWAKSVENMAGNAEIVVRLLLPDSRDAERKDALLERHEAASDAPPPDPLAALELLADDAEPVAPPLATFRAPAEYVVQGYAEQRVSLVRLRRARLNRTAERTNGR